MARAKRSRYINCREVTIKGHKYWRARLTFPFDKDLGFTPPPKDFFAKTAAEADRKRKEWKPEKKTLDKTISFLQYVTKTFLPEQELKAERGEQSWRYYEHRLWRLRKYLLDPQTESLQHLMIRKVMLGALDPIHIEQFFKAVQAARIRQEDEHRLKDDLRAILKSARLRIPHRIDVYFEDLEIASLPKRMKPVQVFTPAQVYAAVTDVSKPIEDRCLVAFEFMMQCRPSEMFALTWDDIDFSDGSVNFYKSVSKTKNGWTVVDQTKTKDTGFGKIGMPGFLSSLLKELKADRATKLNGSKKNVPPFVFLTRRGDMIHKERFKDLWPVVRKSLGLPDGPTFYSLKHLGNSFAMMNGVSPEVQANRMRHSSTKMAMNVYREILTDEKQKSLMVFEPIGVRNGMR